ncbi:MAG: hypothetical protein AAF846_20165 [Chloroflexota bacterium]
MVSNRTDDSLGTVGASEIVNFSGDNVRLSGQIDYPESNRPANGYPLIFVIQHSTSTSITDFEHITTLGMTMGMAVFRWDKRGTGRSGNGANGSVEVDTLRAYEQAIKLPSVDSSRIIIFAQSEGTLLLQQEYKHLKQSQKPLGIILASNMLDEKAVLALDAPLHIIVSKNDWNDWRIYAEKASDTQAEKYGHEPSFYVATNTNRLLMYTSGNTFHKATETSIKHWLTNTCQIS